MKEALEVIGIDRHEAFIVSRRKPNSIMFGFPNNFIEVNPLGLVITYLREDQAF